jgi:hypothetical protein
VTSSVLHRKPEALLAGIRDHVGVRGLRKVPAMADREVQSKDVYRSKDTVQRERAPEMRRHGEILAAALAQLNRKVSHDGTKLS